MPKTWLVIDCHNVAYRAFHALEDLSFGAIKTGVAFGFLREIIQLQDKFGTDDVAFCFDVGVPLRRQLLEGYKLRRHSGAEQTEEEKRAREHLKLQIGHLRDDYLPAIGYRNIFYRKGFEADDFIASFVQNLPEGEEAIIVSSDEDMFQLLSASVCVFNLHRGKTTTLQSFKRDRRVTPAQWIKVKAIAGCKSDEIPGIPGVGEITAVKYLLGELKETSKPRARIKAGWQSVVLRNRPLVQLPFEGTPVVVGKDDEITDKGWHSVCDQLGLKSLRGLSPRSARRSRATFGIR